MCPFSVAVPHVPDRELGPLLAKLAEAGFNSPIIKHVGADARSDNPAPRARGERAELPEDWRLVQGREGESYRWPKGRDHYSPYRVFMATTRTEGAVQIALGETIRTNKWGRDRKYVVAFLSGGSPQQPLVEFVAADDYEDTRELVAVIRGSDGGRRMYGAADVLPAAYTERFRTQNYNGSGSRAWKPSSACARPPTPSPERSARARWHRAYGRNAATRCRPAAGGCVGVPYYRRDLRSLRVGRRSRGTAELSSVAVERSDSRALSGPDERTTVARLRELKRAHQGAETRRRAPYIFARLPPRAL